MAKVNRSVILHDFVLSSTKTEETQIREVVRVEVVFQQGGMNYATYEVEKRGLYLTVCPLKITDTKATRCTQYLGFSGGKVLIQEAKRFSRKQLDECAPDVAIIQSMLDHTCDRNGIARQDAKAVYNTSQALAA